MGKAISGLRIVGGPNKSEDPVNRGNLARVAEAVERDLTDLDDRVAAISNEPPFGDLGELVADFSASGRQDGIYTYTQGGVTKAAIIKNGTFIVLG